MRDLPDDESWIPERLERMGRQLQAERMRQNLTQESVFLAAGINRATLQTIEAGRGNPTIVTLLKISRVLGVPLAELVG